MKLLYELKESQIEALVLSEHETIWYCVPVDLRFHNTNRVSCEEYAKQNWLVVTEERIMVLQGNELTASFSLKECTKIKCEHQVHCGIVTVNTKKDQTICIVRFSMRHIIRVSYVVRGAQALVEALERGDSSEEAERVTSHEFETYCEKCGRALPGTSKCPYCEGNANVLRRFIGLCSGYTKQLIVTTILMIVVAAINLINPMIQQHFIDHALSGGNATWTAWIQFVSISFILLIAWILAEVFRNWNCVKLGTGINMMLREKLYYKIQTLSLSFMNKRKPGELINRVGGDSTVVRRFVEEVLGHMLTTLLTMIASLVMMFSISWKMTLLTLFVIAFTFVITRTFWHRIRVIYHKQWLKSDELSSNLQDVISGMRIVKSFGKEQRETERFTEKANQFATINRKNETFWAILYPILTFFMGMGTYIAIYFGGIDVLKGSMSLGTLLQFGTYCGYLFGPLSWMTHLPRMVMHTITSLNRIYDVLDEEPRIADQEHCKDLSIEGAFVFENVSFGYETYEPVLENISFEVKPGEMIGLVGASGTGKSTLINLIMRLYDVNQGRIMIDGVDIRDIKMESLHSQIGVVLQETFLFSGSILANIRFAKRDATLAEVIQAAKAANAHDFICKTPDGYNTYVGEHGYNLSGGERQRIAIARAILNNPRLLILDEATSALDTESEFLIQQALERLVQGRTTFAIAHRLSTLRNADRLIVIDKHSIAEMGTHNELLEKKGIYYGLVTAQLAMVEGK